MTFNINQFYKWNILLSLIIGLPSNSWSQKNVHATTTPQFQFYQFQQIKTDTLFQSLQVISSIRLPKKDTLLYYFDWAYHPNELFTTSQFALQESAIIAINGGFFNMDKGGSATYFEENDTVFHQNIPLGQKWAIADWAKTGAIIIDKKGQLQLHAAKSPEYYVQSNAETSVLITGPLLIEKGMKANLVATDFVTKRHPRTCICETKEAILLFVVDGRKPLAKGMSLLELQTFLIQQQCLTAINMDGGGSTTMWIKGQGVVNTPSDIFGERKVANALLVKLKSTEPNY